MKRILVLGAPGSGKTFCSTKLAHILNIPIHQLDHYYYKPNWVVVDRETFIAKQREIIQGDTWIIDGNATSMLAERLMRADTVIYLDIPRYKRICRVLWRNLVLNKLSDLPPGCTFLWKQFFTFLLHHVWKFDAEKKTKILQIIQQHPEVQFFHLKSEQEVNQFLQNV